MRGGVVIIAVVAMFAGRSTAEEIPKSLEGIVFGDEKQPRITVRLNGTDFDGFAPFSSNPFLLWPAEEAEAPFAYDKEVVRQWLTQVSATLGHTGFQLQYADSFPWRGNEVWSFTLRRRGARLHDARVMVHWKEREFVGLVNDIPGVIQQFDDVGIPAAAGMERIYYAERTGVGTSTATIANLERKQLNTRVETTVISRHGHSLTRSAQDDVHLFPPSKFKEWPIPSGTFPDQLGVDSKGNIWLSQPLNNFITKFDPNTGVFTQHSLTAGGSGPDGLIVGHKDKVWSGMYYSGSLGRFDILTGIDTDYPAPYANAAMAVPVQTTKGRVWVTDHLRNRISEFDPLTSTWVQSLVVPTASSWIVQGDEDVHNNVLYFTEYNANQLAYIKTLGSTIYEVATPNGGGPAFCVYRKGYVFYSLWNRDVLGVMEVATQQFKEFQYPIANEWGGPIWDRPDGRICVGTRNQGYIMVFDFGTQTFQACQIPTPTPGLKDGLTVDQDGLIWFTETGANKLAVLKI